MLTTNGTNGQPEMEKVNTNIVTLTRFLTEEQVKHKEATGDFTYADPMRPLMRYWALLIYCLCV